MTTSLTRSTTSRAAGPVSAISVGVGVAGGVLAHPHAAHPHILSSPFATTTSATTSSSSSASSSSASASFRGPAGHSTKRPLVVADVDLDATRPPAKRSRILEIVSRPPPPPPPRTSPTPDAAAAAFGLAPTNGDEHANAKSNPSPLAPPAQPPLPRRTQAHAHGHVRGHARTPPAHASKTTGSIATSNTSIAVVAAPTPAPAPAPTPAPAPAAPASSYTPYRFSTPTAAAALQPYTISTLTPPQPIRAPPTSPESNPDPDPEPEPEVTDEPNVTHQQPQPALSTPDSIITSCDRKRKAKQPQQHPESQGSQSNPELAPETVPHYKKLRANALKSELDRLQPGGTTTTTEPKEERRKLRSQEATRFKSDLSAYFPDYDEVIGNEPKQEYAFTYDTPIILFDSAPTGPSFDEPSIRHYNDSLFTNLSSAHRIDLSSLKAQYQDRTIAMDPLPDTFFEPIHRKAERLEKHIRNTERGRAHHERAQVVRLLEELQGHDWLRTMGVSGITESQKRKYEPARDYFIKGCEAIIEKFKQWTYEEKRRKAEKDRVIAERAAADADDSDDVSAADTAPKRRGRGKTTTTANPPLKIKLRITSSAVAKKDGSRRKSSRITIVRGDDGQNDENDGDDEDEVPQAPAVPEPPPPPREITSFFKKRYERDLWLNRRRPPGRKVMAWGVPIPDMMNREFMLDRDILDEETKRTRDRARRREARDKHPS